MICFTVDGNFTAPKTNLSTYLIPFGFDPDYDQGELAGIELVYRACSDRSYHVYIICFIIIRLVMVWASTGFAESRFLLTGFWDHIQSLMMMNADPGYEYGAVLCFVLRLFVQSFLFYL